MTTTVSVGKSEVEQNPSNTNLYVLVVDDEPLLCRMISAMLGRVGFEIEVVMNGTAALESIHRRIPDLITLDVMMPDISGIEVAKRLKANAKTAAIPIIFLTALDRNVSEDLQELVSQPNIYHLDKPFSRQQLLQQIEAAVEKARRG
jgi:CheY-like chemotaxis protein